MNIFREELGYFAKTVSEEAGISRDTLRNWSLRLESEGVEFARNSRLQRIYYQKDIRALKHMKELLNLQQPLNDVAKLIAENVKKDHYNKVSKENNVEITPSVSRVDHAQITLEKHTLKNFKEELLRQFSLQQQDVLENVKKEIVAEMTEVFQERLSIAIDEAVEQALQTERNEIRKQILHELEEKQRNSLIEEQKKKSFWKKIFS